jgi:hypothetical protein
MLQLALIKKNIVELSKFPMSRKYPKTPSAVSFPLILNTSAHLVPLGNRDLFRLADYVPSVDNTRDPTKNTQCDVDEEISGATALYRDR